MMTPGTYIRLRREAQGLTLLDLALRLPTDPPVGANARVDWLAAIEADRLPMSDRTMVALAGALPIDLLALGQLVAIAEGNAAAAAPPALCPACAGPAAAADRAAPAAPAALADIPDGVLVMSTAAMLRHTGQPKTYRGITAAARIATAAGWLWELPDQWRRPLLIGEPRA